MAGDTIATENTAEAVTTENTGAPRRRQEQLSVEEPGFSDENINYPTGPKLWLTTSALTITLFLTGLVRLPRHQWLAIVCQLKNKSRIFLSWQLLCQA
jgi:hypothetical protein